METRRCLAPCAPRDCGSVSRERGRIRPKALDNFARAFSGFTVDATGITTIDEGNRIAWKDVTDYGITEETMGMGAGKTPIDVLYIADKNQTFRTRLGLLNNGHVLLALCEEMAGDKRACDSHE